MKLKKYTAIYFLLFLAIVFIEIQYYRLLLQQIQYCEILFFGSIFHKYYHWFNIFTLLATIGAWASLFFKKHKNLYFSIFSYTAFACILPTIISLIKNVPAKYLDDIIQTAPFCVLGMILVPLYFVALLYLIICDIYILVNRRLQEKRKIQERLTYLESQIDKKIDK